jgi:Protein of unknwon function (DUF3310)
MTKVNDVQIGGDHYRKGKIQPWDYILANDIGYLEGTAIKYLTRWKYKNGVEDLKKAKHFIEKAIENYYAQEANQVIMFDKEFQDAVRRDENNAPK